MQQIERLRKERGLSRYRLAWKAGVSETAVRKWEANGIEHAEYGKMRRIADVLGVRMEELDAPLD